MYRKDSFRVDHLQDQIRLSGGFHCLIQPRAGVISMTLGPLFGSTTQATPNSFKKTCLTLIGLYLIYNYQVIL